MRLSSIPDDIRPQYEEYGATGFYKKFGATYRNPHEPIIRDLLENATLKWNFELASWRILDLACGSGEATLALREMGCNQIDGLDPYTAAAYFDRTGQRAQAVSFEDIARGVLPASAYELCICSFALHLSPTSLLPQLCLQLSLCCARLLILTPHKRPHISAKWGWELKGEILRDRVRARFYESTNFN